MKFRIPLLVLVSSLALAPHGVLATAEYPTLKVITDGGIAFVSGGVGDEEQALFESIAKEYNLRLLMATKDGKYLADVDVAINDRRGQRVIRTISQGPFLFARLPPGNYEVTASVDGETLHQRVAISGTGQREVRMFW